MQAQLYAFRCHLNCNVYLKRWVENVVRTCTQRRWMMELCKLLSNWKIQKLLQQLFPTQDIQTALNVQNVEYANMMSFYENSSWESLPFTYNVFSLWYILSKAKYVFSSLLLKSHYLPLHFLSWVLFKAWQVTLSCYTSLCSLLSFDILDKKLISILDTKFWHLLAMVLKFDNQLINILSNELCFRICFRFWR